MSERYAQKSSSKHGSKRSSPNGSNVQHDLGLATALKEVAKSLPEDISIYGQAVERLVQDYKKARREKGKGTQELNALFDKLYGVYVLLQTCPEYPDVFVYECASRDIDISVYPGGPLSQILVEFYVLGRSKRAVKYAAALPEAALQKIKVGSLAERLGNGGPKDMSTMTSLLQPTSLKAMAEKFADRQKSRGRRKEDSLILARCS
jgi:hypothetical protein